MQSIILIGDNSLNLSTIKKYYMNNCIKSYDVGNTRYVMEFEDGYLAFNYILDIRNSYTEEELSVIPYEEISFISIEYRDINLVKQYFIETFPLLENIWIDDDCNEICTLKQFVDKIKNDPEWDWRS